MAWIGRVLPVCVTFAMGGCASGNGAVYATLQAALMGDGGAAEQAVLSAKLNPHLSYLLVRVNDDAPALLVLGYLDATPQEDTEVWYSARNEVIKLKGGRLVGTFGLPQDWRSVRYTAGLPAWAPGAYTRQRDVQPGYLYGLQDALQLKALPAPPSGVRVQGLSAAELATLAWFEETPQTRAAAAPDTDTGSAWFALQGEPGEQRVVYSRQCMRPGYCLHLQPWPVAEGTP